MYRSRHQVSLPPKDDILAPGIFNNGTSGPRWFDFSTAPDVKGFDSLSCKANITWAEGEAFHLDPREPLKVSVEVVDTCGETRGRVKLTAERQILRRKVFVNDNVV